MIAASLSGCSGLLARLPGVAIDESIRGDRLHGGNLRKCSNKLAPRAALRSRVQIVFGHQRRHLLGDG